MNKSLFIIAIAAIMCSCSQNKQATAHRLIAPLPAGITLDNLRDCSIPTVFRPEDFDWTGGNLTMKVYNKDLYDAVQIAQMQVGDTIVYDNNKMVINSIAEDHGGIDINGGLDQGGCCLAGYEGGTYVARNWDDHATYTLVGKTAVPLADDFVIIDCGEFPDEPSDTIRTGQRRYIEDLKDGKRDFFQLNTRVTITNGKVREINRHWIP